jgi:phosphatidylinositol alpha-1,6-mannosyltransferase
MNKKILFIAKNYPPQFGGMENYCRDLVKYFRKSWDTVYLIANWNGTMRLPWFGVKAFFLGLYYARKADVIWIGDGSIGFIGYFLSLLSGKPRYITIHALDITRNKSAYQYIIPKIVNKAKHIVAVSEYTKNECIIRWISWNKITIIPNGIDPDLMQPSTISKAELFKKYHINIDWKKILLSLGRHIERKWIHWFLENVMPALGDEYVYIIWWWWSYTNLYKSIIDKKGLSNVYLIGRPSNEEKIALYSHSDLFIMPNISIAGDAEWFGIVCIEAGWYGLPVLASNLEGIKDAVIDGETGYLLESWNSSQRIHTIQIADLDKKWVKNVVEEKFDWNKLIRGYEGILEK